MRLDEFSKIYIYSAGSKATLLSGRLKEIGIECSAFIDMRAAEIKEVLGKKVLTLKQAFEDAASDADDSLVIIALNNGLKHESIAKQVFDKGFKYIVYLPTYRGCDIEGQNRRRLEYVELFHCDAKSLPDIKQFQKEELDTIIKKKPVVIKEYPNEIVFFCDIDFIRGKQAIKLTENVRYNQLFAFLRGERDDITLYLDQQGLSSEEEKLDFIKDRKQLFDLYEWSRIYNPGFFINSPGEVIWKEDAYFQIKDGAHRAIYLFNVGWKEVPVVSSKEDYCKYIAAVALS